MRLNTNDTAVDGAHILLNLGEPDPARVQLAVVADNPSRFKNPLNSLAVKRILHTLQENRASSIAIPTTFGLGYLSYYASILTQIPELLIVAAAGFGSSLVGTARIVLKNNEKYNQVRDFNSKDLLGLNDLLMNDLYHSQDSTSYNKDLETIALAVITQGDDHSADAIITRLNDIFTAPNTRNPIITNFKQIHDEIKDYAHAGGARLRTPLEKAYDTATELMKSRLSHTNGEEGEEQFLDQISDLRVIQFHAYNHFMGYLQKCLDDPLQPLGHLPHFNQALVNDLKERHREFNTNFLNYAQNKVFEDLGATPEQFRQDCQEPLGRIEDFIRTGTFNPEPTDEEQGLAEIADDLLYQQPQEQLGPRTFNPESTDYEQIGGQQIRATEETNKGSTGICGATSSQLSQRNNSRE